MKTDVAWVGHGYSMQLDGVKTATILLQQKVRYVRTLSLLTDGQDRSVTVVFGQETSTAVNGNTSVFTFLHISELLLAVTQT